MEKPEIKTCLMVCPACNVKILQETNQETGQMSEKVIFSFGKPGDRDGLYRKVCQYSKSSGCINKAPIS